MDASRTIYGRQIDFKDRGFKIFNFQTVQTYPYNCIGAIYYQNTFGEMGIGTGFLIGPDLILTSAHNVCSREAGQHNNMKFYPGVSGDFEEAQVHEVANFRIPNQYLTSEQSQRNHFNYALLKLNSPIEKAAYVELVLNYTQQSDEIGISGYRRDAHSESSAIQFALWKSQAISIIHSPLLSHKLSTFEGNSGSPILAKREGKVIAVGIHRGASGDLNEARLITNDLAVDLLSWEREMAFFKTSITFNELQGKNHLIPLQKREIISKFPVKVNLANSNRSELVSKFKAPLQSTRKQQQASVVSSSGSTSSLLTSIVIFNDFCKDIEQERRQTFISKAIEYSLQSTVKDLLIRLEKVYENEGICKNFKRYPPRLWLINERIKTNELFSSFKMACKMNPTFDYKLYVQGQLLKAERQLNEYTITGSSLLLVEFRQSQTWMLFNQAQILNACCPYCRVLTDLPVMCSCKVIIYCSEKCKEKDAFAHKKRCPIIQQK